MIDGLNLGADQRRLVDRVYEALKEAILSGQLAPGERLVQDDLANGLGVSRSPVREAVARLAQDGYVKLEPHRGAMVTTITPHEMDQIYEIRELVEPYAASVATDKATREERDELARIVEESNGLDVVDFVELYRLNVAFHRALVTPCGNPFIIDTLTSLWDRQAGFAMYTLYASLKGATDQSAAEHRTIMEAFRRHDAHEVYRLVREHLKAARTALAGVSSDDQP